jgi:hypothetical protein
VLSYLVAELRLPVWVGCKEPDSPGEGTACCFVPEDLSAIENEDEKKKGGGGIPSSQEG